jgi:2-(1,2-epoxy-1,2-dihydrophenyl)acetyl-CoA isomerase
MSVDYRLDGEVAVVTLDRPESYNAIEATLAAGLIDALDRAGRESRAAVLTGTGKAFCSGADLADLLPDYSTEEGPDLAALLDAVFHPSIESIISCRVPVVGAINGPAAGAGLALALACDLRVMAEGAYLTSAFTAIGLVPDSGTTWWLGRQVGVSRALELTLTNRRVPAAEALQLGLCLDVVPPEMLLGRAVEVGRQLADLVPDSLVTTRRLVREAAWGSLADAMLAEQREQGRLGKTREHREGVMAFFERRRADFRSP